MYSQHVTLSTFSIKFQFLTATYFKKARYSLFVLKVPLNANRSVNPALNHFSKPTTFARGSILLQIII